MGFRFLIVLVALVSTVLWPFSLWMASENPTPFQILFNAYTILTPGRWDRHSHNKKLITTLNGYDPSWTWVSLHSMAEALENQHTVDPTLAGSCTVWCSGCLLEGSVCLPYKWGMIPEHETGTTDFRFHNASCIRLS